MIERERRKLSREVTVVEIPAGTKATLPAGEDVILMQSLGGAYTVYSSQGLMYRIDGKDADALGLKAMTPAHLDTTENLSVEQKVQEALKTCFDPEIPVNIVDLGLIYLCEVAELSPGHSRVDVRMTLTAPGCGMGGVLKADVEDKIREIPGVSEVNVELVFDPAWDQSMMSEAAKLQLGF